MCTEIPATVLVTKAGMYMVADSQQVYTGIHKLCNLFSEKFKLQLLSLQVPIPVCKHGCGSQIHFTVCRHKHHIKMGICEAICTSQ